MKHDCKMWDAVPSRVNTNNKHTHRLIQRLWWCRSLEVPQHLGRRVVLQALPVLRYARRRCTNGISRDLNAQRHPSPGLPRYFLSPLLTCVWHLCQTPAGGVFVILGCICPTRHRKPGQSKSGLHSLNGGEAGAGVGQGLWEGVGEEMCGSVTCICPLIFD